MAPNKPNLYPNLHGADSEQAEQAKQAEQNEIFRLKKISEIREFLENEVHTRDKLRDRYKAAWNVFYLIGQVSGITPLSTGAGAVGTLATGIGAPVSIPLGGVSIGAGLISSAATFLNKIL